jgi:hypothetical protein
LCQESRDVASVFEEKLDLCYLKRHDLDRTPTLIYNKPRVPFNTIFFRSLDRKASDGFESLRHHVSNISGIQHLALSLPPRGLSKQDEWYRVLHGYKILKTLTFLVGSREQSWLEEGEIELRDVEEWLVDGRERLIRMRNLLFDVGDELGRFMMGPWLLVGVRAMGWFDGMYSGKDWEWMPNFRVVAWRKGKKRGS